MGGDLFLSFLPHQVSFSKRRIERDIIRPFFNQPYSCEKDHFVFNRDNETNLMPGSTTKKIAD
jgi:hypothetical protein